MLKLGYLSFQNKSKFFKEIFSKIFCLFPSVRMRTKAFFEEAVADHRVKEYQNILQDYWRSSKPDLTICRNKNHALYSL